MAEYVTVTSGVRNGTNAADTLYSRVSEYDERTDTWTTTIYAGLNGLGGDDSLQNVVTQVNIDGGTGNDTIENLAAAVSLVGGTGNDYISNYNHNQGTTMPGGAEATGIYVGNNSVSIDGGDGDDTIINGSYDGFSHNSTLIGGNGNDFISSYGSNVSISGGAGNDNIGNYEASVGANTNTTVDAGIGDDSISNTGSHNLLLGGDGNDTIHSTWTDNTLRGGNGNDHLEYSGTGSVESNILMDDTVGNNYFSASHGTNVTINGGSGADTVNGYYITNTAINIAAGNNSVSVRDQSNDFTINAAGGNDSIDIGEYAKNFVVNVGDGANYIGVSSRYTDDSSYYTITGGSGNDSVFNNGGNHAIISTGAGNDVIMNSYDHNFTPSNTISAYNSIDAGDGDDSIRNDASNITINGGKGNDTIVITDYYYADIKSDSILINYASGDGNDYITGFNATSTLSISGGNYSSVISGNNVIIGVGNSSITLDGAGSLSTLNIVGGSATQAPDTTLPDTTSADTTPPDTTPPDTTPADPKLLTVSNLSKSPITLGDNTETVDASARVVAVEIIGNDLNNSIVGGINNDTLNGGAGNDTLTGSKGKNIFIYSAGDDVITDYKEGKDSIQLDGATISNQTLSGSDVVLKTSNGSLTLTDAIGKEINIDGETIVVGVAPGPENLTVNNQTKSPVTLGTATKTVDASKRILRVEIVGNDLDNTINGGANSDTISGGNGNDSILGNAGNDIINGDAGNDILRGGSGNDTLNGGAGNDSLWGDKGADTFIYDSGDDIIYGFDNKDLLEISGDFTSSYADNEIKLTIGNGSITLKEFTATSFNINGDTYTISEGNFVKK